MPAYMALPCFLQYYMFFFLSSVILFSTGELSSEFYPSKEEYF